MEKTSVLSCYVGTVNIKALSICRKSARFRTFNLTCLKYFCRLDQGSANTGPRSARCRPVKKLLLGRAEPRPNWSKSDWNDWYKEHTAGAIDYHNPCRSEHLSALRKSKPRSLAQSVPWWLTSCNTFPCVKHSLFYWRSVRKIMPGWKQSAVRKSLPIHGLEVIMSPETLFWRLLWLHVWIIVQTEVTQADWNQQLIYRFGSESFILRCITIADQRFFSSGNAVIATHQLAHTTVTSWAIATLRKTNLRSALVWMYN